VCPCARGIFTAFPCLRFELTNRNIALDLGPRTYLQMPRRLRANEHLQQTSPSISRNIDVLEDEIDELSTAR